MSVTPFPKIPAYRREADALHSVRGVVCLEKLDGTNTRVHAPPGARSAADLVFGGRTLLEHEPGFCQPVLREAFVADARATAELRVVARELGRGLTLYGETCGRGIQAQGHVYGPRPHFVLFAARSDGVWLSHGAPLVLDGEDERPACELPALCTLAARLGLTLAPCLYTGPPDGDRFAALAVRPSEHAQSRGHSDAAQEGIVIWSDPLRLDGAGRPIVAKLKDPRRCESDELDDERAVEDPASFAARVVRLERLLHARQHLEETGRWADAGSERPAAITRRVVQDVAREEPRLPEADRRRRQAGRAGRARAAGRRAASEAARRLTIARASPRPSGQPTPTRTAPARPRSRTRAR